jgi:hypothetical protein
MENFNDFIEIQPCDLPACNRAPQPSTISRALQLLIKEQEYLSTSLYGSSGIHTHKELFSVMCNQAVFLNVT